MSNTSLRHRITGSQRNRKIIGMLIKYLVALVLLFFALFPVVWIISASINPANSLATQSLIPANATLENYEKLLTENPFSEIYPYKQWFVNSFKLATITTIISISITTRAA